MEITVIVPTYCPMDYLWECLNSLCEQTLSKDKYEVIVVLNGCKEPYHSSILNFINNHQDVQWVYIQTDQGGVSNARNVAIDSAKGEYITFLDDDDYISPFYLDELSILASKDTVSLCYPLAFEDGTHVTFPYSITQNYHSNYKRGKQSFIRARKFFSGPVYKLIHRDIIGSRRFNTKFRNGEDSLFMFYISDRLKYVDFTSKNAVYYRRIRSSSANQTQTIAYVISNCYKMFIEYSNIFFRNCRTYSFKYYVICILGLCHQVLHSLKIAIIPPKK